MFKRNKPSRTFTVLLFAASLLPAAAYAQTNVQSRLERLENEIQTLNRAIFKGETPPPGAISSGAAAGGTAELETRLSQMENDIRDLTGRLEKMDFENRQLHEKIEQALAATQHPPATAPPQPMTQPMTGGGLTGYPGAPSGTAQPSPYGTLPPQPAPPPGAEIATTTVVTTTQNPDAPAPANVPSAGQLGELGQTPDGTFVVPAEGAEAVDIYEQGFSMLRDRNYADAEKAFTVFLERFPEHNLAANAKYWLGETFYVRNDFERAARVFAEAYQKYPKGPKGADNLLKLALSLAGLGKKDDACLTLKQLKREYPAGSAPVLARADRESIALGCSDR